MMKENKNPGLPGAPEGGVINGHEYVDLGLSVLWATCNVGASSLDDYGQYFAWGETEPKDSYTEENYKGQGRTWLEPDDDPAYIHWGDRWRMPTQSELHELIYGCDWKVYWRSGERPYCRVTSKTNGNSIILPRGGYWDEKGLHEGDVKGHLGFNTHLNEGTNNAPCLSIDYCHMWECDMIEYGYLPRYVGMPIRPVAKKMDILQNLNDIIRIHYMPRLIYLALDKWDKKPDDLLGYRMVFQRKAGLETVLDEEIRLVDGSVFTRSAQGGFEHAFIQLCVPQVPFQYRTVGLSSRGTKVYVDVFDPTRYWMDIMVDVPGGEKEACHCQEWLRDWVDCHRKPSRIQKAEIVADDLRKEGKRVPVKMHICYKDVPDPGSHDWSTRELIRSHQDMVAWKSEKGFVRAKTDDLLTGGVYRSETLILAKMLLDETLGIDCEWQKIDVAWADGE